MRYNPEGDAPSIGARRRAQTAVRLLPVVESAVHVRAPVAATKAQMDRVQADRQTFDLRVRPELTCQTICTLQDAGVEPDVWKIKGSIAARTASAWLKRCAVTAGTTLAASFSDAVPMRKRWRLARDRRFRAGIHRIRGRAHDFLGRSG